MHGNMDGIPGILGLFTGFGFWLLFFVCDKLDSFRDNAVKVFIFGKKFDEIVCIIALAMQNKFNF